MKLAIIAKKNNVPSSMVVFMDETGERLCPSGTSTYHPSGDIQVKIVASDDKRYCNLF